MCVFNFGQKYKKHLNMDIFKRRTTVFILLSKLFVLTVFMKKVYDLILKY